MLDTLWLQNDALIQREKNQIVKNFLCGRKDALNEVIGMVEMQNFDGKKVRKKEDEHCSPHGRIFAFLSDHWYRGVR